MTVVDLKSCHKIANTNEPFILVLKKGENLLESILQCANITNLKSASLSGLGAVDDINVAYYHLDRKEYSTKLFKGSYELVSLNGNISFFAEKRFIHVHAALGTPDYNVVGGHIMEAFVGPTTGITIIPLSQKIERQHSDEIGLKLMCPIDGQG